MSRYAVLDGQIRRDMADLEQLAQNNQKLLEKVQTTGDVDYLGTVALNLHSFYSGANRIFRDVALTLDATLPEGSDWHRRLLRQMAAELPDIRPALLSEQTFQALNDLCAFQHGVRNVYTFDLVPSRVQEIAEDLPDCWRRLQGDLQRFCLFLQGLNGHSRQDGQ